MSDEQKPIEKERIDNPDGTYTIKEVYGKPNFGCYLSNIEVFDSDNKMINGLYYDDRKFKKLLFTDRREYLDNGQYYKIQIWEKPQSDGWLSVKCLCDCNEREIKAWFYEDKQSKNLLIYQEREYLENNITKSKNIWYKASFSNEIYQNFQKRTLKEVIYNDTEFKNITSSSEYFYNDDNSYKVMSLLNNENGYNSSIEYFNNKNQNIRCEIFYDKNFSQLHLLQNFKYKKNGQYMIEASYEDCDENGWKSTIEKYDKNNKLLLGKYYQKKNFKNLGQKTIRKYYKDGRYKDITKRTFPHKFGWYELEEIYDQNNRVISGIYKTSSKEPNRVIMKEKCVYYNDTYDRYCTYTRQAKDKNYLSFIERHTCNNEFIFSKHYKDRHFKTLCATWDRKYIAEGHYIDNIIEDSVFGKENYKSLIHEANTNENWEKESYYKNNNFTNLLVSTGQYVNANGNKEKQIVYENDQGGWYSTIFIKDEQERIIKQLWFSDKEFKNQYIEENLEYNPDGTYISSIIYYYPLKEKEYHPKTKYDNKDKILQKDLYKDKELTRLFATDTYEYLPNNKSIRKTLFKEAYESNIHSSIEYINERGKATQCLAYTDNNFKNLYRKSWWKYSKKYEFVLRIYKNAQANYNTEIEKYDNNEKLIYKKQYKTNFVFARILFWLAL